MGSMISLGVGKLEIDWGKNSFFRNHSKLFLPNDVKDIPYYYAENIIEHKEGFSRKLGDTKRRLELLGYPLQRLKSLYESHLLSIPDYYPDNPVTYEEFYEIMTALDPEKIRLDEDEGDYDLGEFISDYLFKDAEFNKKMDVAGLINRDIGTIFENMDPYIILRILMENQKNSDLEIQWRYADVLEGSYVTKDELYEKLLDNEKIIIVTEGSSDSFVIGKTLELLYSDIKDFFSFVDMEEHYPFTGTGNLYRFCQGLSSINIQNNVLIIYDNDVEGMNKFNLSKRLTLPRNMKITKLPDYKSFLSFPTIGPNGKSIDNINGHAVSIECFLDLSYMIDNTPCVRWTSYDSNTGRYQGELIDKEKYIRKFKQVKSINTNYDFTKLVYLINYLYKEWISNMSGGDGRYPAGEEQLVECDVDISNSMVYYY